MLMLMIIMVPIYNMFVYYMHATLVRTRGKLYACAYSSTDVQGVGTCANYSIPNYLKGLWTRQYLVTIEEIGWVIYCC